jgi:integrase
VLPTQEQINAAIKCANPVIGLSIMLLAGSGIRRGELLGLRWEDVHLEDGYIDIKRNLQYVNKRLMVNPPKTKKSRRKVTLTLIPR